MKTLLQEASHKWVGYILLLIMMIVAILGVIGVASVFELALTLIGLLAIFMFNDKRQTQLTNKRLEIANKYSRIKLNEIEKDRTRKEKRRKK